MLGRDMNEDGIEMPIWLEYTLTFTAKNNRKRWQNKYAVDQYEHVRSRRNHGKAIVAVARHLAESTEVDAQEAAAVPRTGEDTELVQGGVSAASP